MEPSHLLTSAPNQAASTRANDVAGLQVRDRYSQTPLDLAAWLGQTEEVKILLRYTEDVNVKDILGQTPLHGAAIHGDRLEIVELLVKHGADPNIRDREGRTAFYLAVTKGKIPAAKLLLEYGADVNAKDSHGDAAPVSLSLLQHHAGLLQRAITSGNFELTRILLLRGADINIQDEAGHGALHKAAIRKKLEIFDLLLKYSPNKYLLSKDGNTTMDLTPTSWKLQMDFHDLLREFTSTSPAMMPRLVDQTRRRAAILNASLADLDDLLMAEHLELLCQWSMPLRKARR
jgi:ankyrin repeat protein